MSNRTKMVLTILGVLVIAACFVFRRPNDFEPPVPSPNGFNDFIRAGASMQVSARLLKDLADTNALGDFVEANAESLQWIRNGLRHDSRVFIDFSSSFQVSVSSNLLQVAALKNLVPALLAEGRLAEFEGRSNDALKSYLDALRVSHEAVRGGLHIHKITGFSMEQLAIGALQRIATNLDAGQCRHAALVMGEIEAKRELMQPIIERERGWAFRTGDWQQKLLLQFFRRTLRRNEQQLASQFQTRQRKAGELMIALAVRAYQLERGKAPETVTELVPTFLKSIPSHSTNY